ncbi:MAG TPA: hypothetical protein VFQ91_07810 [Bryobacteraceae bacterium]|nr:hypothetical protein [Bryobacteraceae bacterium]
MADEKAPETKPGEKNNRDEVALELMKFIAVSTGYGKGSPGAGFAGKSTSRSAEEYADSLLELFQRCRQAVGKPLPGE